MKTKIIVGLAIVLMCICTVSASVAKDVKEGVLDSASNFNAQNTFTITDDLYVKITGPGSASHSADIYIVAEREWSNGDELSDMVVEESKMNAVFNYGDVILMWNSPLTYGKYDVFVDMNQNGRYEADDVVDTGDIVGTDVTVIGFEVLPELTTLGLLGLGVVAMTGYFVIQRKK